jgi:NAD(P)-dependent dehydrogenase (short-subunit alcohol dehydrogenase family)
MNAVKVYVVTGANGEIGTAICQNLSNLGHRVIAVTRQSHEFRGGRPDFPIQNLVMEDITQPIEITKVFDKFTAEDIHVSGIVYGAAIFNRFENLRDITVEEWNKVLDINLVGAFLWARGFAERCVVKGQNGSIVNIASQAAFTGGYGGVIPYAASKGALVSMTKGLAREFAAQNVRVNCVAPGFIETGAMRGTLDAEKLRVFYNRVPMGRFGTVDEVASVVEFLLSDKSSYITGSTLDVTGGQLMH